MKELITNGGFESGFSNWQTVGDALVVDASIGVAPTQSLHQALITTASDFGDFNNFSGSDAVEASVLESFLGLSSGLLAPGFEGSAIRTSIAVNAGDILRFDYNFLTTDASANDFAFVTLAGIDVLADSLTGSFASSAVVLDPIFGDVTLETGYRTFSYTFLASGTYSLGIGVLDADDKFLPSGLLIDNVRLVPEPSTITMATLGSILLAGGLRLRLSRSRRGRA